MSDREKELFGMARRHQHNLTDPVFLPSDSQKADIRAMFEKHKYFGLLTTTDRTENSLLDAALARLVSSY
jgi:hypothetical protein